jgi:hypothetical protein
MLLRDTLTDRAEAAPDGHSLLTRVRTRSRLIRRRRRVGAAGAGVAAVLLGVAAVPVVSGLLPGKAAPEGFGGPAASGTGQGNRPVPGSGTEQPTPPSTSASPPPTVTAVLGPPNFTVPKIPFKAPTGVIEGLSPAVGLYEGNPIIMHSPEGRDVEDKPLLALYINARLGNDIPGERTTAQVRGVEATVITPSDKGPGPYLSWTEPDGTPMYLAARNIPIEKLIAYANGLTRGETPAQVPFTFKLLPQGLELDNINGGSMVFKAAGQPSSADYLYKLGFFYNADGGEGAASWPLKVGSNRAQWSPVSDSRLLMVSQPNGYVIQIQVPENLKISDDDVLRMAAGVTVNETAKAGRG